jgi:hypothetical protein
LKEKFIAEENAKKEEELIVSVTQNCLDTEKYIWTASVV